MSFILDAAVLIIVISSVYIGVKRGAFLTLANLICSIVGFLIAAAIATPISTVIYSNLFKDRVTADIGQAVSAADVTEGVNSALAVLDSLPGFIKEALETTGFLDNFSSSVNSAGEGVTTTVESAVSPIFISFISIFVFMLCTFLVGLLLRFILKKVNFIFKLPVIRVLNSFLGGAIGLVSGVVVVFMAIFIITLFLAFTTQPVEIFSKDAIEGSIIFRQIYGLCDSSFMQAWLLPDISLT